MKTRSGRWMFLIALVFGLTAAKGDVTELVTALSSENDETRLVAFDSIAAGQYGADAIGPVAALLDHENPAIAGDARFALEKIVGPLAQDSATRAAASEALCAVAETAQNRSSRRWLLWLVSYTGGSEAMPHLVALLDNPAGVDMALFALQAIGGEAVTAALLDRLDDVPDATRIAYIDVLGAIGGKGAIPALLDEAKRPNEVGLKAAEALGRLGAGEAEPMLWERIRQGGDPRMVSAYLRMAEHQPPSEGEALYRKLLSLQGDARTRCAALAGLGRCGGPDAAETILPYLASERADVFGAARAALIPLEGSEVNDLLRSVMASSGVSMKISLLEILFRRDPEGSRRDAEEALNDPDDALRAAGLALLGETGDPKYQERFLELARSGSAEVAPVAQHAYLLLADSAVARGELEPALAMYHTGLEVATEDAERQHALEGLTRIGSPQTLPYLERFAASATLQVELGNCALAIAENLSQNDSATSKSIYQGILDRSTDVDQANRAARALRAMGEPVDVARKLGFITHWNLIGPFPNTGFASVFPPETEYDPQAEYDGVEGARVKWTGLVIDHVRGIAELDQILKPNENVIAYAHTEIDVPEAVSAQLWLGSDDGVQCWVNGKLVHSNDASRRVKVDQDKAPISLQAGRNTILLKIVQGGGGSGFCARIMGANGQPIAYTEVL